jgi:ankyrin repeat protein
MEKEKRGTSRVVFLDSIKMGDYEKVHELLYTIPNIMNQVDSNGKNALHYAALYSRDSLEIIELLLQQHLVSDIINGYDNDKDTPLDVAIKYNINSQFRNDIMDLIRHKGGKRTENEEDVSDYEDNR